MSAAGEVAHVQQSLTLGVAEIAGVRCFVHGPGFHHTQIVELQAPDAAVAAAAIGLTQRDLQAELADALVPSVAMQALASAHASDPHSSSATCVETVARMSSVCLVHVYTGGLQVAAGVLTAYQ